MRQELVHLGSGAHALAIQLLGNREDAADVVHDAFAVVLARPDAYDVNKGALRPWFFRVVRNRCLDLLRRRKKFESVELVCPGVLPDTALENAQRDEQLHSALLRLKRNQREILVLRDYLDFSYAEIAAVMDIAPGTVMSRLHRARMALKAILEPDHE